MMSESQAHKRAKRKAAGQWGQTEAPLKGRRRLDAKTPAKATEVERSGNMPGLLAAAARLKVSYRKQKVLQVPQNDMAKAAEAMQQVGVGGTVKNMQGTKRRSVRKR